ncbi:hypothetical protein N9K49_03760 [Flavobacteriaceae bacterium]|nr:hypothetical protein [Flavobacteriaceae bacterium]
MISAIVISFYDHDYIKECIASIAFVDEIIIVGKIDEAVLSEIQETHPVRFIESISVEFDFLLERASSKASHDWIVGLEANQSVSDQLAQEITEIALNADSKGNYKVKTRFNFMGKLMKFSGYRTSYTSFLFHKNSLGAKAATKKLKTPIEELYLDFDRYNERLTKKAKLKAQYLYGYKKRPNFLHFSWNPLWTLKKIFFFQLGLLDGKEGFIFAYLNAFKEFKTYLFLWLMYRNIE